jgi:hypothetical protein
MRLIVEEVIDTGMVNVAFDSMLVRRLCVVALDVACSTACGMSLVACSLMRSLRGSPETPATNVWSSMFPSRWRRRKSLMA